MLFKLFYADCIDNPQNCIYPNEVVVSDLNSLLDAISHDYVGAKYLDGRRSNANFIQSDCLIMDCDNDHSDNPDEWVTPDDVKEAFPDVYFAIHFSRDNMKSKNGRTARPKFHVLFPINKTTDRDKYCDLKQRTYDRFPYFDNNALDSARFFYGTNPPKAELIDGTLLLDDFLTSVDISVNEDVIINADTTANTDNGIYMGIVIPQGQRNSTMSRQAGRILTRFGDTEEAHENFLAVAEACEPPLDDKELDRIWKSGQTFYHKTVAVQPGYVPPAKYNQSNSGNTKLPLKPTDFSDVGQARVLSREYTDRLRYSPATDYIVYNGSFWEESRPKAQGIAQELTDRQLHEAKDELTSLNKQLKRNTANSTASDRLKEEIKDTEAYRKYIINRRNSRYISASLKESQSMLEIDPNDLDADEFLLNTPSATYDLRDGASVSHPHSPNDFITKQTSVDPGDAGMDEWHEALDTIFVGDADLIEYVQEVTGLAVIGKVYIEGLIISYGTGKNGKSTFWNTISRVMGTYSGKLSADTLTTECNHNPRPELAEAKGKRLLIASELEEGNSLSTSNMKQLCSTDEISAEKKYKAPFKFTPTHLLVLYTNYLPKVGAMDEGTWRRLIVIPFNAKIDEKHEVKNFADHLYNECGGAVLKWIMDGAKKVIENDFHLSTPKVVEDAIQQYREDNNWLAHFLEECCDVDSSYHAKAGEVYDTYHAYALQSSEKLKNKVEFSSALKQAGFTKHRTKHGILINGLRLKSDFLDVSGSDSPDVLEEDSTDNPEDDFLN